MKKKIIVIFLLIVSLIILIYGIVKVNTLNKSKMNAKSENVKLFSYEVYDNQDENNIKLLATINSENGIEYVIGPDNTKNDCNGKNQLSIDYTTQKDSELTFKIKEKNKDEVSQTIILNEESIYNHSVSLNLIKDENRI